MGDHAPPQPRKSGLFPALFRAAAPASIAGLLPLFLIGVKRHLPE